MSGGINFRQTVLLTCLVIVLIALTGCSSMVGYGKMYEGPPKSRSEVAFLTHKNPYMQDTLIVKVDGKTAAFSGLLEFEPGKHTICAGFYEGDVHSVGCSDVEFTAETGHVYLIYHVRYTHNMNWYPAVMDITDELGTPQYAELAEKIEAILQKNREKYVPHTYTKGTGKNAPGFGEEIQSEITGKYGEQVDVEYKFNRYRPYIIAEGSDGKDYHLQISQQTGEVVKVIGTKEFIGDFISGGDTAFQPLGQPLAYVYGSGGGVRKVYREVNRDEYELELKQYITSHRKAYYVSLLPVKEFDKSEEAAKAMVLALNADAKNVEANQKARENVLRTAAYGSMEYRFGIQGTANDLARTAVSMAEDLVENSEPGTDVRALAEQVLVKAKTQKARCDQAEKRLRFVPPIIDKKTVLRFFATDYEMTPYKQRSYAQKFDKSKTRFIGWELNLQLPAPGEKIEYDVYAVWHKPDGSILTRQTKSAYCGADWTNPWHAHSWGWKDPGHWPAGVYTVELFIGGKKVASQQFEILEG